MGGSSSQEKKTIFEPAFLEAVKGYKPTKVDGVAELLKPGTPDYQANINKQFELFVSGQDSAIYLGFQPIWNAKTRELSGVEILCRSKNGGDAAPMPGLAIFQATAKDTALKFLIAQLDLAKEACKVLPGISVSVNVRPDELLPIKAKLEECGKAYPNFVVEVTEYSPIEQPELDLIQELVAKGVNFAIDDVTEVEDKDRPSKCFASKAKHACSFQLAKERTDLFRIQKLSTALSASVWRVGVFPTPEYDGGKPQEFLLNCVFPKEAVDDIQLRKGLVDDWVKVVKEKRPDTVFVMECTVYPEDLTAPKELYPDCGIFDGMLIQGGKSGGRVFPLELFTAMT